MQLRVAVIGKSKIIVQDISNRIFRGDYFVCPIFFNKSDVIGRLERLYPHVIVLCINDEEDGELEEYNIIKNYPKFSEAGMIIIAHPQKYKRLNALAPFENPVYVERPLRIEALFNALEAAKNKITVADDKVFQETIKGLQSVAEKQKFEAYKRQRMLGKHVESIDDIPNEPQAVAKVVLVVDSDVLVLASIKEYLTGKYLVICVPNAMLALKFMEKQRPDVIIMDYNVSFYGKNQPKHQTVLDTIPKIVLAATTDKAIIKQILMGMRPTAFLQKPLSQDALLSKLEEVFATLK